MTQLCGMPPAFQPAGVVISTLANLNGDLIRRPVVHRPRRHFFYLEPGRRERHKEFGHGGE
jgi:hypothetical protein